MNIWINKCINEQIPEHFEKNLTFNLFEESNKSHIKTDVVDLWRKFGFNTIKDINEDLIIIALTVFAIDKRIPRGIFADNWTRTLSVNIPVIEVEKWNAVKDELEKVLGFLSGDIWIINFRKSDSKFRKNVKSKKYNKLNPDDFDCVSLFSGGLDSFCGSIKLLSESNKVCFVGFKEYGVLRNRQNELFKAIDEEFKEINKSLLLFNATPLEPINFSGQKLSIENTSRSRSFLFLAGALAVASIIGNVPVYIPENGFIGLNVPLTDSRNGSCSTRTTHPYFIRNLNIILDKVGIENKISNFYAYSTKGEIVSEVSEYKVFQNFASKTISCSHPCQSRYDGFRPPINCGYCYPCLIRRASMNKIGYKNDSYNTKYKLNMEFIQKHNNLNGKASDLKAVLYSVYRFMENKENDEYIENLILRPGELTIEEIDLFKRAYKESMKELLDMIKYEDEVNDGTLKEYLGMEIEEEKNV